MAPTVKATVSKSSTSQSSKDSANETEQTVKNDRKIKPAIRKSKRSNNLKDLAEKLHEKTVDESSGGSGTENRESGGSGSGKRESGGSGPEKTESGGSGPEKTESGGSGLEKKENDSVDLEPSAYSLDTEMVWTTKGNEVASVTVIDMNLKTVFESLVKPTGDIIDYNTEYSGITEEDMKNATSDLNQVREKLLELFSEQTILMGHSLEFDLIGLKIIHYKVVDTSIAFPHNRGPPFKRALKTLAEDYLGKRIQKPGGHDSKEDSIAVMELMLLKTGSRKRPYPFDL